MEAQDECIRALEIELASCRRSNEPQGGSRTRPCERWTAVAKLTLFTLAAAQRQMVLCAAFPSLALVQTECGEMQDVWFQSRLDVRRYVDDMNPPSLIVVGGEGEDTNARSSRQTRTPACTEVSRERRGFEASLVMPDMQLPLRPRRHCGTGLGSTARGESSFACGALRGV